MTELKTHLGCWFRNADDELIECWQLLTPETNRAVACADFRNGKLERFDASAPFLNQAKEWLERLRRAAERIHVPGE